LFAMPPYRLEIRRWYNELEFLNAVPVLTR
jgi:hypothetical protein